MVPNKQFKCALSVVLAGIVAQLLGALPAAAEQPKKFPAALEGALRSCQRGYELKLAAAGDRLRKNPSDFSAFHDYLEAWEGHETRAERLKSHYGLTLVQPENTSLDWLLQSFHPRTAFDALRAGDNLAATSFAPLAVRPALRAAALKLLNTALSMKFTAEDKSQIAPFSGPYNQWQLLHYIGDGAGQPLLSVDPGPENQLRYWAKLEMAKCYHDSGEKQHEYDLLLQLAADAPGQAVFFARQARSLGPQFARDDGPLEKILQKEDARHANDSKYWLTAAQSYGQLKNDAEARKCLEQALAITEHDSPAYFPSFKAGCPRLNAIDAYADYLVETGHKSEAVDLLKKEVVKHPDKQVVNLLNQIDGPGKSHLAGSWWRWVKDQK